MHVVITGASSGIGAALAREYGAARPSEQPRLTLIARRGALLSELAAGLAAPCHVVPWDLGDPERATGWLPAAEAANGPVDLLINNAGLEETRPASQTDEALGERLLRVNLLSPLRVTRAVLPGMLQRRSGAVVHVCSVDSLSALPGHAYYGASKAGLAMFSEVLASELRGSGVHVLTVYPGPVQTPMGDRAYEAYGGRRGINALAPEGRPEVLARRLRAAVDRRRRRLIYPRFYTVVRYCPWLARWIQDRLAPGLLRATG